MMNLLYIYHRSRERAFKDYKNKTGPDTLLYGLPFFEQDDFFETKYIDNSNGFFKIIDNILSAVFKKFFKLGFKAGLIWENLNIINKQDIIFCTADSTLLPLLFFKKIKAIKKNLKIYGASIGLTNNIANSRIKIKLIKFLLKEVNSLFLYSSREKETINNILGLNNFKYIPFGIDTDYFSPSGEVPQNIIVSSGHDSERDYKTLITAWKSFFEKNKNIALKILTEKKIKFEDVPGLEIINDFSMNDLKRYYEKMLFGVMPIKKTIRSSGQTVSLSMLAMNKIVIADKKSPGLADFGNCDCILPYDAENADSLKIAMEYALNNSSSASCRKFIIKNHSSRSFYENLRGFF